MPVLAARRAALMGGILTPGMSSAEGMASLHMQQLIMEQQQQHAASSGMPCSMYPLAGMMMHPGATSAPLTSQALQHYLMHGGAGSSGMPMPMAGMPPALLPRLQAGGGFPPGLSPSQLMQLGLIPPSQVSIAHFPVLSWPMWLLPRLAVCNIITLQACKAINPPPPLPPLALKRWKVSYIVHQSEYTENIDRCSAIIAAWCLRGRLNGVVK